MSLIEINVSTAQAPPASVNLYRVKADQETYFWNFQVRPVVEQLGSAPAVNRTGELSDPSNFVRSTFTRAWQFFWADLLAMRVFGKLLGELSKADGDGIRNLFTALTKGGSGGGGVFLNNNNGTDRYNNHVLGIMQGGEDPKIDPLICATSKVEVLEARKSLSGKTSGLVMGRLKTFLQGDAPPVVTRELLENDPRVLRATVIWKDGRVTDFPQIYQRYPQLQAHWVPYPLIARQDCWYPIRDLGKVSL